MRTLVTSLESAIQDVRYGARLLARSPWFTFVGVASLGIGLGAAVGLFTFMNALLFRPLHGRNTTNIHAIYTSSRDGGLYGGSSFADFRSFIDTPDLFAAACATTNVKGNLVAGASPLALPGALVSGGCFDALQIRPYLGRLLNRSDETPSGEPPAVVISHSVWTRAFGGDSGIAGRTTLLNGVSVVIVGVAEPGFAGVSLDAGAAFWASPQLAATLLSPDTLTARGERRFRIYVRLEDGVTAARAADRLAIVAAQLRAEDPGVWTRTDGSTRTVTVVRELDARFAGSSGAAEAIGAGTFGAVAVIVAIACVNLAMLTMARGVARTREISLRLALGATRARLLRQLGTESVLISVAGLALGGLIVSAGLRLFDAYRPAELPGFNMAIDWRVAGFSALVALVAPVLFGLAPGMHALRLAIAEGLKGRAIAIRTRYLRLGPRELLLAAQVVVSFALLIMSALFMRSLAAPAPRPGPSTEHVAIVHVDLNTAARSDAEMADLSRRLIDAAARVPDVDRATAAALVPMTGSFIGVVGRVEDRPDAATVEIDTNVVAPGYFELTGTALRAGRDFDLRDHERAPRVAVVSESLARSLWDTTMAVGRRIRVDDDSAEVVGVVADVAYRSTADTPQPVIYVPLPQAPQTRWVVHARVKNDGEAIAALDRAIRAVNARVIVGPAMPLRQLMEQARMPGRVAQQTGALAGLVQLALTLMATWGLVAYTVERRIAEIALRRALGATDASILGLVMRPSLWILGVGGVLGSAAGVLGAKALHSSFLGLAPIEPVIVVPAAVLIAPVVAAAAWWPARRAASIEPASALKQS